MWREKKYPNVEFSFTGPETESSTIAEHVTKTSVDLMSGTAGDIIDVTGLPYIQYAKNNLLEDLYSYMESDKAFNIKDYYTNILDALEYDNKLYCMPLSFLYWCVRFNSTLLDETKIDISTFDTVDYKDIADIYHTVAVKNDQLLISHLWDQVIFEENEYVSYLDEKNRTATFDSLNFINFLNEMNSMRWPSKENLSRIGGVPLDYAASLEENDLCCFIYSAYNDERNAGLFLKHSLNVTAPIPITALNGDKAFFTPDPTFAITTFSKNKELAWLFIRFCIEEKKIEEMNYSYNWFLSGYPINRNNTLKQLEKAFGQGYDEEIARIDLWNSERNETGMTNYRYVLLKAIEEISYEFYAGRITAEECAAQIQERAEIYLKE
jgi:multiple sugar transport system substrate-binding protein